MRKERTAWVALLVLSLLWVAIFSWMLIQKFLAFRSGGDLGIFVQAIWSTAHGHPFYMSLLGGPGNFLGHHFAPLLAVLAPIYYLWPDAGDFCRSLSRWLLPWPWCLSMYLRGEDWALAPGC